MHLSGRCWCWSALLLAGLLLATAAAAEQRSETLVFKDFESGGLSWWSETSGASLTNETAWSGNRSCKFDHEDGSIDHLKLDKTDFEFAEGYVYYLNLTVNITSIERVQGSGDVYLDLLSLRPTSGASQLSLRVYANGSLRTLLANISSGYQEELWLEEAWNFSEWFAMLVVLDLIGDNASFGLQGEEYYSTQHLGWVGEEHPTRLLIGEINSDQDAIWYTDHFYFARVWYESDPVPIPPGDPGWVGNASDYDELPGKGADSFSGTVLLRAWDHHAFHFSVNTGGQINYDINVAIGGPVDFYLMTEGQYKRFIDITVWQFSYIKGRQHGYSWSGYHSESGDFVLVIDNDEISADGASPTSDVVYEISFDVEASFLPGPSPALLLAGLGVAARLTRRGG